MAEWPYGNGEDQEIAVRTVAVRWDKEGRTGKMDAVRWKVYAVRQGRILSRTVGYKAVRL